MKAISWVRLLGCVALLFGFAVAVGAADQQTERIVICYGYPASAVAYQMGGADGQAKRLVGAAAMEKFTLIVLGRDTIKSAECIKSVKSACGGKRLFGYISARLANSPEFETMLDQWKSELAVSGMFLDEAGSDFSAEGQARTSSTPEEARKRVDKALQLIHDKVGAVMINSFDFKKVLLDDGGKPLAHLKDTDYIFLEGLAHTYRPCTCKDRTGPTAGAPKAGAGPCMQHGVRSLGDGTTRLGDLKTFQDTFKAAGVQGAQGVPRGIVSGTYSLNELGMISVANLEALAKALGTKDLTFKSDCTWNLGGVESLTKETVMTLVNDKEGPAKLKAWECIYIDCLSGSKETDFAGRSQAMTQYTTAFGADVVAGMKSLALNKTPTQLDQQPYTHIIWALARVAFCDTPALKCARLAVLHSDLSTEGAEIAGTVVEHPLYGAQVDPFLIVGQ
ncbi:MAG: hypothetical protein HY815_03925 [Candidatus Riflebacteria bacterium]|nr:hypothetical protein [Candidatus Riflebacteria bacterium]